MSINFNAYGFKAADMNIRDLEVGQTLIRVIRDNVRYDNSIPVTTAEYVVVKVLKTRLVLEAKVETQAKKHSVRLIVDQASWKSADRRGFVETNAEGESQSYRRAYEFATEDESELIAQVVAHRDAQIAERKVKEDARMAVREIASNLHPELESIDAAIAALTALRDQMAR